MKISKRSRKIFKAFVKASSEIKNLYPSMDAEEYSYIPLEDVINHLKSVLPKYKLSFIQGIEDAGVTTKIIHKSGQWIEFSTGVIQGTSTIQGSNTQKIGAAVTYYRRYSLCLTFGITGDYDNDASEKVAKKIQASINSIDEELKRPVVDMASEDQKSILWEYETSFRDLGVNEVADWISNKVDIMTFVQAENYIKICKQKIGDNSENACKEAKHNVNSKN